VKPRPKTPRGVPKAPRSVAAPEPVLPAETTATRTTQLPTWSRLQMATKQSALFGMTGDFFEVFQHRDERVSTVMADVCGRGPAAAVVVSAVRPVLRQCLARGDAPGMVLAMVNDWLTRLGMHDSFVTALAVRIDVRAGRAEVASAGHLGPFLRKRSGGVQALTVAVGGVPLGMLPEQSYPEVTLDLEPDDALVLVTDGITDPLASEADVLGERGLLARLERAPHGTFDICHALLADNEPARDDATVLVLHLPAASPPLVEAA
jgi:serine phosphatase RsbU (regulator of sigma subunit)